MSRYICSAQLGLVDFWHLAEQVHRPQLVSSSLPDCSDCKHKALSIFVNSIKYRISIILLSVIKHFYASCTQNVIIAPGQK